MIVISLIVLILTNELTCGAGASLPPSLLARACLTLHSTSMQHLAFGQIIEIGASLAFNELSPREVRDICRPRKSKFFVTDIVRARDQHG